MRASFNITINNTIVKESNARIKSLARYALKGNWTVSVCVVAICTTLMNLPAYLSNYLPPVEGFDLAGFALTLLSVALMGACTLSMQSYFLKLQRMEGPGLDS